MLTSQKIEDLIVSLALPDADLYLFADGAGNYADRECGWYCMAYDKKTGCAFEHVGGANGGTNNYAELMPFCHALWAYHSANEYTSVRVVCVSDSEVTVRCGSGEYARRANGSLWASIEYFEKNGYKLTWRHVSRNSNWAHSWADSEAKRLRAMMKGVA